MGKRIDAIKRQEQMTPQEVMAGLLWARVVNSQDHFTKFKYYEYTAYFEFSNDNNAFLLDVYYLGQDHSFMLIQPNYKEILVIEIDDDDYDEIYQELLSEIENASEYDDYIDLTDDEIYALADYLIPFVIKQIEKRGNDAIEFYYSND